MSACFFATDLHGRVDRYQTLFALMRQHRPDALFLGGDLLPSGALLGSNRGRPPDSFLTEFLAAEFARLREEMGSQFPHVFLILGNDDPRCLEDQAIAGADRGLWAYVHGHHVAYEKFVIYGYSCVPPTPFQLKDWERYDVSRYVDPGCIPPEEGKHSLSVSEHEIIHATIAQDLAALTGAGDWGNAIFLFHSPPYQTQLDRAGLDDKTIDYVPLDLHIGSIAIRRLIETRQPLVTLHGHVHESTRLTGEWREQLGATWMFQAAHDGPELAVVVFDPSRPENASRLLV